MGFGACFRGCVFWDGGLADSFAVEGFGAIAFFPGLTGWLEGLWPGEEKV